MEIQATVPRRGEFLSYARPDFFKDSKINNLREFYGVGQHESLDEGYSPFHAGRQNESGAQTLTKRPWMGIREGHDWSPASSTYTPSLTPSGAHTDVSYPVTAATSRPRTAQLPQSPVQIIKHVVADPSTLTEERIAMMKLKSENEELRRMCSELQNVVDLTVERAQHVSEDAQCVASMARKIAAWQAAQEENQNLLQGDHLPLDFPAEVEEPAHENSEFSRKAGDDNRTRTADVLRVDTNASQSDRELHYKASHPLALLCTRQRKPTTPRVKSQTSSVGFHTPRDCLRPGTASFTPRLSTPRSEIGHAGMARQILTPCSNRYQIVEKRNTSALGTDRPATAQSRTEHGNMPHALSPAKLQPHFGQPTAQSRASTASSARMKRQRPTPGRRTYIALYRDGMLGKVEDFSRLVFPEQEGKRLAFLDSMNKQQDGKTRLVSQNGGGKGRAGGDNASLAAAEPKFRPLAELTDRVSWDGTCWKQGPKDSRLPYDGWPGIRRQVHWEPLRGGGAGHSAAVEWSKLILNNPGGKIYEAAMPIVNNKVRAEDS